MNSVKVIGMTRENNRYKKERLRLLEAAWKLCFGGLALLIATLFLGNSPLDVMLAGLRPVSVLMILAGCALLLWDHSKKTNEPNEFNRWNAKPPDGRRIPNVAKRLDSSKGLEPEKFRSTDSQSGDRIRPHSWSLETLKSIEWRRFEALIEALFKQAGFETKTQSHGADQGVDIWLYSRNQPGLAVSIVQCKHWTNKVGVEKLRELRGVMAAYKIPRGQFVTTASYSDAALKFAKENGINALDAQGVLNLISKREPDQQQALLDVALEGEYWRPTCVNCGIKLIERSSLGGGKAFWGCQNYPRCKTTMQMRR